MYVYIYIYVHAGIHVCVYICTCRYTCMCIHIYIYVYTCICLYIYIHTDTQIGSDRYTALRKSCVARPAPLRRKCLGLSFSAGDSERGFSLRTRRVFVCGHDI